MLVFVTHIAADPILFASFSTNRVSEPTWDSESFDAPLRCTLNHTKNKGFVHIDREDDQLPEGPGRGTCKGTCRPL